MIILRVLRGCFPFLTIFLCGIRTTLHEIWTPPREPGKSLPRRAGLGVGIECVSSKRVTGERTRGLLVDAVERVGAAHGTDRFLIDILRRSDELIPSRHSVRWPAVFESPSGLGALHCPKVGNAARAFGSAA